MLATNNISKKNVCPDKLLVICWGYARDMLAICQGYAGVIPGMWGYAKEM